MSFEDSRLGRLRVAIEGPTRAAFAVDQTGTPSNFLDVPYVEGSVNPARTMDHLDPQTTKQFLDAQDQKVLGRRSATLAFGVNMCGPGVAMNGVVTPLSDTDWWLARLLSTTMGGLQAAAGPGVPTPVVSATTTVITMAATHGNRFVRGTAIAVAVGTGAAQRIECREVLSNTSTTVTVKVAFSVAPAAAAVCYSSYTFFMSEDPLETLQVMHEGYEQSDRFAYLGLQGGFAIDVTTAALARATFNLSGANWLQLSTAALGTATIANYNPVPVVDSEFIVQQVGVTTRNVIDCQAQQWAPNVTYSPITTPAGVQTMVGWRRARGRVISGSFQPYFNRDYTPDWYVADGSRYSLAMFQQIGSSVTGGGLMLLSAPTVQIMTPARADNGGLSGLAVQWEGRHDEALTTPTSDLERSAFRIHIFR